MAHDNHVIHSLDEQYEFTASAKSKIILAGAIGLALVAIGAFLVHKGWNIGAWQSPHAAAGHEAAAAGHAAAGHGGEHHGATLLSRIVANIWLNAVYFTGIAVVGAFFVAYNYLAQSGWYVVLKRVPEAFPQFVVFTGAIILALFLIPASRHEIFHWTHEGIMTPGSANYDEIIAGKSWYLNFPFFLARICFYFIAWYWVQSILRKNSLLEDINGGLDHYWNNFKFGIVFLVIFAVTSSTAAWDLSLSIDTHWFSTMFGWYHLASWHVSGLATIMLVILLLKDKGYLSVVNDSHIHDLGKLMFGFSVFWTYVWFSQYLLIFYAHLPEETIYFRERFTGFGGRYWWPFHLNVFFNFAVPFLVLMMRRAKRTSIMLKVACASILIGHWFDFYQMHMPGIAKDQGGIGIIEWGTTLFFASAFIYSVSTQLTKANLIPKNHPFLEESLHHDI
jgi:hypothetical protein